MMNANALLNDNSIFHERLNTIYLCGMGITEHGIACPFPRKVNYPVCATTVIPLGYLFQSLNSPCLTHAAMFVAQGLFMVGLSKAISSRPILVRDARFAALVPLTVPSAYPIAQINPTIVLEIKISILFGL